uniref:Uncharacterized protein n=1 Tax=Rhizophagus irregularis (strain DAOM 181602 / DAOM 197198 / MUCL 43194) TaxID=747089 RepID=U9TYI8_RHIID
MKELVQFALADLVVRGLVQEKIILRKTFEGSKGLSSSIVVIGVVPGAQANANMQTCDFHHEYYSNVRWILTNQNLVYEFNIEINNDNNKLLRCNTDYRSVK